MTSYVDLIEAAGNTVRVNGSIVRCQIASIRTEQAAVSIRHRVRARGADDRPVADPSVERGDPFGFLFEDAAVPEDANLALNNW